MNSQDITLSEHLLKRINLASQSLVHRKIKMELQLQNLKFLGEELLDELILKGKIIDFKKGDVILTAGNYVKSYSHCA